MQYDTSAPFTARSSWTERAPAPGSGQSAFDGTPVFATGAYDGRFLYYVPAPASGGFPNGTVVRHDGSQSFTGGGWSSFDTRSLHASPFGAAVFDGKYLYLAPFDSVTFARFDAKDTPSQPSLPEYFGSFY
jgi:hypothetical protein